LDLSAILNFLEYYYFGILECREKKNFAEILRLMTVSKIRQRRTPRRQRRYGFGVWEA
jgi:hypothetical protein